MTSLSEKKETYECFEKKLAQKNEKVVCHFKKNRVRILEEKEKERVFSISNSRQLIFHKLKKNWVESFPFPPKFLQCLLHLHSILLFFLLSSHLKSHFVVFFRFLILSNKLGPPEGTRPLSFSFFSIFPPCQFYSFPKTRRPSLVHAAQELKE